MFRQTARPAPTDQPQQLHPQTNLSDNPVKETECDSQSIHEPETCTHGCCINEKMGDYVIRRGFLDGVCSDITVRAFGKEYNLHRLFLDRSGYFSSLFNGPWLDSQEKTVDLVLDHDEFITKDAFEVAISRLYGVKSQPEIECEISLNLIAVGQYLDIPQLVCSAIDYVNTTLNFSNLTKVANFAVEKNYGSAGERLIENIKGVLCSDGWFAGVKNWDAVPTRVITETIGLDCFFVETEWDRAVFIIKLIERRQRLKLVPEDEIDLLKDALNTKVHFCHMTPEKLHRLETWRDRNDEVFVSQSILREALWASVDLQKKVSTAHIRQDRLGIATDSQVPANGENSWFVPPQSETFYGTPKDISKQFLHLPHSTSSLTTAAAEPHTHAGEEDAQLPETPYKTSTIPPFRFSVAFTGISTMVPDKRVYSKTFKYAGSYWNLYIQKVQHKKGFQMGVYIHRAVNAVPSKNGVLNKEILRASDATFIDGIAGLNLDADDQSFENNRGSVQSFSTASEDTPEVEDDNWEDSDSDVENSFLEYEDRRLISSVYYMIYTPSRKVKPQLTCFASSPDQFKQSQSWGWKSQSMCSFNENGVLVEGQDEVLKFMVVLGNA